MKRYVVQTMNSSLRAFTFFAIFAAARIASGANDTWNSGGGDNNWTTANNWGGTAPLPGDSLFFGSGANTAPNDDFADGTIFGNLTFTSGSAAFTLGTSGGGIVLSNAMDVSGNGQISGGGINNLSASGTAISQTVNLPITFSAGSHFIYNASGAGTLNLSGTITRDTGTTVVFTNSSANNITGPSFGLENNNGILGGWATIGTGAGQITNWASLDGSGNVVGLPSASFTGVAAGGTIVSGTSQNIKITSEGTAITSGAGTVDINSLYLPINATAFQNVNPASGAILRFGAEGGILNASGSVGTTQGLTIGSGTGVGTITAGGADNTAGELTIYNTPFTAALGFSYTTINSVIADNGNGVVTVNVVGYLEFSAANTYSGNTYINQGRVQALNVHSFGSGPVYVFPGAELYQDTTGTWANNVYLSGVGSTEGGGIGAIRMNGTTISGTVTLMDDAVIGGGINTNNVISGVIKGPGGLIIGHGTIVSGSGAITVGSTSGPNTYQGDTTIHENTAGNDTLKIATGANNIMPNGSGAGNVIINGNTFTGTFDLNGTAQAINGLSSSGTAAHCIVESSSTLANIPTLIVGNNNANGSFAGIIENGNGTYQVGVTKVGAGSQALTGPNTYTGSTTVSGGTLLTTTASTGAGWYLVNDGATLDVQVASAGQTLQTSRLNLGSSGAGCTLQIDFNSRPNPTVPVINAPVFDASFGGGPVTVNLLNTAGLTSGTFTIMTYSGTPPAGNSYTLVASPRLNASLQDDGVGHVTITLNNPDTSIVWDGSASGNWDINDVGNLTWKGITSGTATDYTEGGVGGNDAVQFTDAASGTTTVNLTTTVSPSSFTVNNTSATATANYTFQGSGKISGTTGLTKTGTGTLTLADTGGDNFNGGISIFANGGEVFLDDANAALTGNTTIRNNATLEVGYGDANGSLPSGTVTDNGSLIFDQTAPLTVANIVSGSGLLWQDGFNTLMLSGVNSAFSGTITIYNGTLQPGNNNSLGALPGGAVTIDFGGTLDIGGNVTANNANYGAKEIEISGSGVGGNGTVINSASGVNQQNAFQNIVLIGDATIGGPSRWDIRGGTATLNLNGHTLTKSGACQNSLVSVNVSDGNVIINQGTLSFESTPVFAASAGTIKVNPGGYVGQYKDTSGSFTRNIVLNGGGTTNLSDGASTTYLDAPILLTADSTLGNEGGASAIENFDQPITDGGSGFGLSLWGAGTTVFEAANIYSGNTTINSGSVLMLGASGSINNTANLTIAAGGTFDVSAITSYTLSASTTFNASGGANIATITGGNGGTMSLASQPIVLTYDGSHPALSISQGTLALNGNAFTVNTVSPLASGTYTMIQGASGSVNATGSFAVSGTAIGPGTTGTIEVTSGTVNLIIKAIPAFSGLTASQNITLPTPTVTLSGNLSAPGPIYPAIGETITVTINGNSQTTTVNDSTGDFSIVYDTSTIPASATPYTITYAYAGNASLTAASDATTTLTVTAPIISNPTTDSNGHPTFSGSGGTPGTVYGVESAASISGPWIEAGTVMVGSNGTWSFTDTNQTNPAGIFYRLYFPDNPGNPPQ